MLLVLLLTLKCPRYEAISVRWGAVVVAYAAAKLLEAGDSSTFD